ncbi:MAG: hypothetical protein HRU41_24445 [Saprospiraceae bacterium]|nr:hypothetical protein [Saprospiraceae bacterium]
MKMIGRFMIGLAATANALFSWFDFLGTKHSRSHDWHEHARFHNSMEMLFFSLAGGVCLWLVISHWREPLIRRIVMILTAGQWICFMIAEFIIGPALGIDTFPTVDKTFGIHDTALMVMGTLLFIFIGYWLDRRAQVSR